MTTLVELVRKSEAYRFKSRELLERASDPQPKALRGLHLSQLLEFAAAALVLGDDALAHSYLQRFITEGLALASDKTTREAELEAAQAGYHEFAEPYFHLSLNGLRLELALGCRRRLEDRASLREMAERAAGAGCLGYESYLVELARGRREQAEATRAEYWAQWLEDELLWEDDLGWKISIALGQGRQQDFQELVAQFIHREEQKLAAHGPHGHHFSSTVLGLEGMAILGTAQACKMPFPTEMLSHFGLAELIAEGKFGCTSYPPRSVFRTRHSS